VGIGPGVGTFDYELVLNHGLTVERQPPREFSAELRPGVHLYVADEDWVIVQVNEREGLLSEAIARPSTQFGDARPRARRAPDDGSAGRSRPGES
jgi:hypothetical protein